MGKTLRSLTATKPTSSPPSSNFTAAELATLKISTEELHRLQLPKYFRRPGANRESIKCREAAALLEISCRHLQRIAKAGFITKPYTAMGVLRGFNSYRAQWKKARSVNSRSAKYLLRVRAIRLERLIKEGEPYDVLSPALERLSERVREILSALSAIKCSFLDGRRIEGAVHLVFAQIKKEIAAAQQNARQKLQAYRAAQIRPWERALRHRYIS